MEEKRMVGDYTVLHSIHIGQKEVVLGENTKAVKGERYLCCYSEQALVFEKLTDGLVSDGYAEIMKVFAERVAEAAGEMVEEIDREEKEVGTNNEILKDGCEPFTYEDNLTNKVVVVRGNVLRPEFRRATRQLMLCVGGFGAQPNSRGRTCYCISLYDQHETSFYRQDILGTVDPDNLPDWAKDGLGKAIEQNEKNKKPKERGEAR